MKLFGIDLNSPHTREFWPTKEEWELAGIYWEKLEEDSWRVCKDGQVLHVKYYDEIDEYRVF